ncbi:MAG: hypothetical protein O3B95_11250 [Chloroflexi bacterium]|nr:hypothetical protein [Chloroflexota bacterium]
MGPAPIATFALKAGEWFRLGLLVIFLLLVYGQHHARLEQRIHLSPLSSFPEPPLVRMVLVPSSMKLLGKWNWYLPDFLSWLPDIRVESSVVSDPRTMTEAVGN